MTGSLIDPEGRCERCGRLVPLECPEPDGLACGTYVLARHRAQHHDTMQRLRAMLPPSPRDGETSIGYEPANAAPPPDLDVPPDEPCPDCDGTGWASESNPGTGGGTGRDEQIAVECPRGCPEPTTAEIAAAIARGTMTLCLPELHPTQAPLSPAHASLGSDGRITTVYPSGESYTDPTPRLDPATPDITEEAFFAAMDDLVERVTGKRPEPTIRSLTCHPATIEALRAHCRPGEPAPVLPPALAGVSVLELYACAEMDRGRGMLTYDDGSTAWLDFATGSIGERTATLPVGFGARGCPADEHGPEDGVF